jgi:hypothetical protein
VARPHYGYPESQETRYQHAPIAVALDVGAHARVNAPGMETTLMPEQELDQKAQEIRRVWAWRVEQLRRLGLASTLAVAFADVVDWHALAALIDRGCPPELALEIVR